MSANQQIKMIPEGSCATETEKIAYPWQERALETLTKTLTNFTTLNFWTAASTVDLQRQKNMPVMCHTSQGVQSTTHYSPALIKAAF